MYKVNRIVFILSNILLILFLSAGLYSVWLCFYKKIIFAMYGVVVFGILSGVMFSKLYLGAICYNFVCGILYPQVRLRKAAPLLSPIQTLITNGNFEEAAIKLNDLYLKYPENTLVLQNLVDLYRKMGEKEGEIYSILVKYFKQDRPFGYNTENIHLLLLLAEIATQLGEIIIVKSIFEKEAKRNYPPAEKQLILRRLESWE